MSALGPARSQCCPWQGCRSLPRRTAAFHSSAGWNGFFPFSPSQQGPSLCAKSACKVLPALAPCRGWLQKQVPLGEAVPRGPVFLSTNGAATEVAFQETVIKIAIITHASVRVERVASLHRGGEGEQAAGAWSVLPLQPSRTSLGTLLQPEAGARHGEKPPELLSPGK